MTAVQLLALARAKGATVATAESCTGGLLAGAITTPPGASDIFRWGVVTYANEAKIALLGVRAETLAAHGAVSEQVAAEMADGARVRSDATWAISVSGIAGPGGSEHKPEGRVCFGLAGPAGTQTRTVEFGAIGRDAVRAASVAYALDWLVEALGP